MGREFNPVCFQSVRSYFAFFERIISTTLSEDLFIFGTNHRLVALKDEVIRVCRSLWPRRVLPSTQELICKLWQSFTNMLCSFSWITGKACKDKAQRLTSLLSKIWYIYDTCLNLRETLWTWKLEKNMKKKISSSLDRLLFQRAVLSQAVALTSAADSCWLQICPKCSETTTMATKSSQRLHRCSRLRIHVQNAFLIMEHSKRV